MNSHIHFWICVSKICKYLSFYLNLGLFFYTKILIIQISFFFPIHVILWESSCWTVNTLSHDSVNSINVCNEITNREYMYEGINTCSSVLIKNIVIRIKESESLLSCSHIHMYMWTHTFLVIHFLVCKNNISIFFTDRI